VVRGQYEGYRSEPGVAADSDTETMVAVRAEVDNWRWHGVPFFLRSGKAMGVSRQIITLGFQPPPIPMFPAHRRGHPVRAAAGDLHAAAGEPAAGRAVSRRIVRPGVDEAADRALPLAPAPRLDAHGGHDNGGMALVAFVVNRTLLRDPRRFGERCRAAATDRGWDPWFGPAGGMQDSLALTRRAVAAGASLVFAAGGDGTVRACAEALAGTGVPLAIVPLGTANLTARALGVPSGGGRAVEAGFGGRDHAIDLGHLTLVESGGGTWFAAMAGIGLDAAVVAAAGERLKRRLGWAAYAAAGIRRLALPPREFTIRPDGAEPLRRRARSVVVANAGLLPGGFTLLPAARLDDGLLDVGILAPSGGWDWIRLAGRVLARGQRQDPALECLQARRVQVSTDAVLPRQVDGEIVPPGRALSVSVCPGILTVRLPG
jgi:diacylglycerol kinase family enzyme